MQPSLLEEVASVPNPYPIRFEIEYPDASRRTFGMISWVTMSCGTVQGGLYQRPSIEASNSGL